jgi:HPt (histidine-containing phosphotransfer) domain-containing protein
MTAWWNCFDPTMNEDQSEPEAARDDELEVIDTVRLHRNMGDDLQLLKDMAVQLGPSREESLRDLREAVRLGDAHAVEHLSHRMAGSLGIFYAARATAVARRLEESVRERELSEAADLLARLEGKVATVLDRVATLVAKA